MSARRGRLGDEARDWAGACTPYDPVKAFAIAFGAVALLAVLLSVLFSSPDQKSSTIRQWSLQHPINFLETAVTELAGTSVTAEYGPPYNHHGDGQHAAFLAPQKWLGVSHPIDTAQDFVIGPVRGIHGVAQLQGDLAEYVGAPGFQKDDGIESFENAVKYVTVGKERSARARPGEYENVDNVMNGLLNLAQSGGLEGDLLSGSDGQGFLTDYTKPLLFMADGAPLEERAKREHLLGHQWAMMNETGSYPGQPWLWPYTALYEIEPIKGSENADILVWLVMAVLGLAFVCVPLLPGVRSIPRLIPIHRLIWREHHRSSRRPPASA
jgi:hypothetical protein